MTPRTVHLIDASPYIFRAYYSLPGSIRDSKGAKVGAVYGFASFLLKLIADEKVTHLGVAFDRNLNGSFRNRFYPAYKEQRQAPPADLVAQIDPCVEVASALGAFTCIDDEYEADDLIATLAAPLTAEGHDVVIVTSDKDLAQLVSDRVTLYDFGKGERYTAKEVHAKFGVRPDQITDLLALAGDPVDNIPGVKGIGPKSAAELLEIYGHVEDLYEQLDAVRFAKLRAAKSLYFRLAEGQDNALLSKVLATVAADAPVKADLDDLAYEGADAARVDELFTRLGFKGIRDRVPERSP
ncbi:MAG TPA: 5'-3' exonuclease H3TH domain-containing protein [Thermoanaerobaculia bacterium]|jgi:5'-3' exonuclease|nr:5'-3' exonuclease H3TH domain-containing protein [Thermoanaerobaculia bacterium]